MRTRTIPGLAWALRLSRAFDLDAKKTALTGIEVLLLEGALVVRNYEVPDWDVEQLEVILEAPSAWQLVVAGPGAGKSAVACQRVAFLVDEGVPASRILLVSFTRTAVAEIRERIVKFAVAGDRARGVRISTIDSHAWALRSGFEDEPLAKLVGEARYEVSIAKATKLIQDRQTDLLEFLGRLEQVIIDEAQDIVGVRIEFVAALLNSLSPECGVTILADPEQGIYGFTGDDQDQDAGGTTLLSELDRLVARGLIPRFLHRNHRVKGEPLQRVFAETRAKVKEVIELPNHIQDVQRIIRSNANTDSTASQYSAVPELLAHANDPSTLVLMRRRADVIFASSYCSSVGLEHRLRMSQMPLVVRPWVGWLLFDYVEPFISREIWEQRWQQKRALSSAPFAGQDCGTCWTLLHHLAAGKAPNTVDLVHLRHLLSRGRPPVELCYSELGTSGPILSTIHASKGREASTVALLMGSPRVRDDVGHSYVLEEGRVYYVGATRARHALITAGITGAYVDYLESRRIFRRSGEARAQLEIGREGDVDPLAHLAWATGVEGQAILAGCVGKTTMAQVHSAAENRFLPRIFLEVKCAQGATTIREIGEMGKGFVDDLKRLWGRIDTEGRLRPAPSINNVYMVAVSTVCLNDDDRHAVRDPFSRSGFALVPVLKGFPTIPFFYRRGGR